MDLIRDPRSSGHPRARQHSPQEKWLPHPQDPREERSGSLHKSKSSRFIGEREGEEIMGAAWKLRREEMEIKRVGDREAGLKGQKTPRQGAQDWLTLFQCFTLWNFQR